MLKAMLFILLLQPMGSQGTGAHVMLWLADLSHLQKEDWPGKAMFFEEHTHYGRNSYVLLASHPSQWWLTAYAVYFPTVALSDISEACEDGAKADDAAWQLLGSIHNCLLVGVGKKVRSALVGNCFYGQQPWR